MPLGYVANNNDQCPETDGKGSATGCILGGLSNENFVYSITPQIATDNTSTLTQTADAIRNVTYYDGLGRAKQSIAIQQSPSEKDVVAHMEYDAYGKQAKEYLPYASVNTNGAINTNPKAAIVNYYKNTYADDFIEVTNDNEINAYSEKLFDYSPLNRVLQQAAPGKDWKLGNGHEIKFEYKVNDANEVRLFEVTTVENGIVYQPTLTGGTEFYAVGELYKTITKDENWMAADGKDHTTEEFKDKKGNVVLKRTYNENEPHDTYYVYDDFGNLTYVLPPKVTTTDGVSDTELSELCYQYKYDYRNRLVEKKIAGKAWEYVVYDQLDRPVLTQDANLKAQNKWLFTKYDKLGRVIYTGIYTHTTDIDQSAMQVLFNSNNDSVTAYYETKTTSAGSLNNYYTNTNFPSANVEVLTVNYYDTYTFDKADATATVNAYGIDATNRIEGLATGTKVKVLGTNDWITTVTFYDEKARPIYMYLHNAFLGTTDRVASRLDFVGRVEETTTTHQKTGKADIVIIDTFQYDHTGRLLRQQQKINEQPVETIVSNSYDALGQLSSKKVGGDLQTINYDYNIRGWLTKINEDANNDNDLFNFSLAYNDPSVEASKRLYNGNIAKTSWQTENVNKTKRSYVYGYDALNRIKSATGIATSNYDVSGITYDKNGNITQLIRKGHRDVGATVFGNMDYLAYYYDNGNKLTKVHDYASVDYGFKDGNRSGDDYSYDANGNMKTDANKDITNITYNHLNLPTRVTIGGKHIDYTYDAAGMKLRKVVENTTTDYAGNYIYEDNDLQFFNHAEGYVKVENVTSSAVEMSYVYQYKDHLGNVRLSYTDNDGDGKIDLEVSGQDIDGDGITGEFEIIEEKNYYPFGLKQKGYNNVTNSLGNSKVQKFGYNGIELEEGLGLNLMEMDMRQFDPTIARWTSIDPVTHYEFSTYNGMDNNPVYWADPSGADSETFDEYWNRQVAIDKGEKYKDTSLKTLDVVNNQFNRTELGGRSMIDFESGESIFLSSKEVTKIFESIVQEMNMLLQESMWNEAVIENYGPVTGDNYKKIQSMTLNTIHDLSGIDKMIGNKPISAFWGSVELDENNNVIKSNFATGGDILIVYYYGTGTISGFKMGRDENGNPKGQQNVWGVGQDTFTNSNPYGIKFKKGKRTTGNRIAFKTNKGRTKFWNYYKKLKEDFIKQFNK
ncbi:conserved hypothetical protein [Tenacibaculum amylolyticum]